jgi:hypothetical protein
MPRSRSLLLIGCLVLVAAVVGGLVGTQQLRGDPTDRPATSAAAPADAGSGAAGSGDRSAAPRHLPAPSLFVAPGGDDAGPCGAEAPCASFDRAYHAARPGQVVEVAGGSYGPQVLTRDPAKAGAGCERRGRIAACVVFQPARNARVDVAELDFGANYKEQGPAGIAVVAGRGRSLSTGSTNFIQAGEVALWGVRHRNLYVTGGHDLAVRGGSIGGQTSPDGLHPEIQSVYRSSPAIVPTRLTIEGVRFHDINTTSPTAHVDCLQVESGVDLVIRGNTFERCGSTGLRISYGGGANENPPRRLLIERNVFRSCDDTPVSPCYYAAQLGIGHDVVIRGNVAEQALQPAGDASLMEDVRYEANVAPGVTCERGVTYVRNRWTHGRCSSSDRRITRKALEAALRVGSAAG